MVPFAGWDMPVQYSGILAETRAVRSSSGLFDVSHMGRLHITGPQAGELMDWVLTGRASNLRQGRARYAFVCNEEGGIVDDTVFYRNGQDHYLLVCNASNRQQVVSQMRRWADESFSTAAIEDRTETTVMIAFQGPSAVEILDRLCGADLAGQRSFSAVETEVASRPAFVGRTGYTGEEGCELIVGAEDGPYMWKTLMDQGAVPCGLGARDVLRLEAGLPLHGHDIDPSTTPLEAGLQRFVQLDREFVGAEALKRQSERGIQKRLVGLMVQGRSIARPDYPIFAGGSRVGSVTSGTHSPTLDRSIAMGYVLVEFSGPGQKLQVEIRGKGTEAEVVPLPFYIRNGGQ